MNGIAGPRESLDLLHPRVDPFDQRMLPVDGGHSLYVEQCGSPDGVPVVFLHGGPGGGCSPEMRRYFDPTSYRTVLFDQRGCGRSHPNASVEANTTGHLVNDIECIREELGIDRWIVFGGSWGATLALIYAQTHAERVAHLVLRGVFLMTQGELDWFYGGGAAKFRPDQWARFIAPIPGHERSDLIAAYNKRLFNGDLKEETRHARTWFAWENALTTLEPPTGVRGGSGGYARTFARIENHYFTNKGFLARDGLILDEMDRIKEISGTIVQGRYDIVCPPAAAWALAEKWPAAKLDLVLAGHALSEPNISRALVLTMNELRGKFGDLGF